MTCSRSAVVVFLVAIEVAILGGSNVCAAQVGGRDIGLVLSGGGAKGAYEVGVWKAICETGIDKRIGAISGTSVGSICAVLFSVIGNPDKCVSVWMEASTDAFQVNIGAILVDVCAGRSIDDRYDKDNGILSKAALRKILNDNLAQWPPEEPVLLYATASEMNGDGTCKRAVHRLNALSKDAMIDCLMASAAIPFCFTPQEIGGKSFQDGFLCDNVPVAPIVENDTRNEIKTLIVVHLSKNSQKIEDGNLGTRTVVEIWPSEDIDLKIKGMDDTDRKKWRMFDEG